MIKPGVKINFKKLKNAIEAFETIPMVQLGILGAPQARTDGERLTNATIGAKHEFGDEEVPMRSWLRMPITTRLKQYLSDSGFFTPELIEQQIEAGDLTLMIQKIGIVGERVVADGFDSGGFGVWKPSNMYFKKNHQTLIESQQLRNSITSEVV